MTNKFWKIGITGLVVVLLADVAVLQARLTELYLDGLREEVGQLRDEVVRWQDWQKEVAEVEVGGVANPSPSSTLVPTPLRPSLAAGYGRVKEVYVPLGSGSTFSQDWVNVGGQSYIDTRQYQIREVYFEASLRSNSGRVEARLLNKNENEMVAGSEIAHNTSASTLIRSGKLVLPAGNKLYGIQLRSEAQQEVFVDNAKVRLVVSGD